MNNNVIDKIQEEVGGKYPGKGLQILNGSYMLEKFQREGKIREEFTYVPFNEAMCWGDAHEIIFSETFVKNRVKALNTTEEEYRNKTSEISKYIIKNIGKDRELLVGEQLKTFPQYGLGDLQYKMIIDEFKTANV